METVKKSESFTFQRKGFKRTIIFFLLSIGLLSCSPFRAKLDQLGSSHNYDDVSIPVNFDFSDETNAYSRKVSTVRSFQQSLSRPSLTTFRVENREFRLAHNRALRWNGCYINQEALGGASSDNRCGTAFLHRAFHENLNRSFSQCIRDAAGAAGYPEPVKVFIHHVGTYSNRRIRNGRTLSLHARARAMDIVRFNLFDGEGRRYVVSTYRRDYHGSQAVFYDEFRDCWKTSLPDNCAVSGRGEYLGSIGHSASRLGGDSLHNDHLHLSFPLCATEV